jgi:hypothetical protein
MQLKIEKLRKLARGRVCLINTPECCHDPERTVLCHIRRGNVGGTGLKPHDLIALPGCDICNDISDGGRKSSWSRSEIDEAILGGYAIWINYLLKQEIVVVCI